MKESASRLVRLAKGSGITVFIVGHVTKSGSIAGPKVVEHMVDTVLYLEGDRFNSYRCVYMCERAFFFFTSQRKKFPGVILQEREGPRQSLK